MNGHNPKPGSRRYVPVFTPTGPRPIFAPVEIDACAQCSCGTLHYFELPDPVPYEPFGNGFVYRQTSFCKVCRKPVTLRKYRNRFEPVLLKGGKP